MGQVTDIAVETRVSSREIYKGRILRFRLDEVSLPNGAIQTREVIEHPGGVTILPVLPSGKLLLIRQYRYALDEWIYEFPAGKLEPGEDPLLCGQRELAEETGYQAASWRFLTNLYPAPGFCNEKLHLYEARELTPVEGFAPEADEFIEIVEVTREEAWQMVQERKIVDAKTICILTFLGTN